MGRGVAWIDTGLVFTRENGGALRPDFLTHLFPRLSREGRGSIGSGCTTCGTRVPALPCQPACP